MSEGFTHHAGGIHLQLVPWQVRLLSDVVSLVEQSGHDPALPVSAYPNDRREDIQYQRLIADERDQARSADQSAVSLTLEKAGGGVVVSRAEAEAWLRVIGEARLIIGDRLAITEAGWEDDDEEESEELAVLHYLSWLQGGLVEVVIDELPPVAR